MKNNRKINQNLFFKYNTNLVRDEKFIALFIIFDK